MVARIPLNEAPGAMSVGQAVELSNGMRAVVSDITDDYVEIDANHQLAGQVTTTGLNQPNQDAAAVAGPVASAPAPNSSRTFALLGSYLHKATIVLCTCCVSPDPCVALDGKWLSLCGRSVGAPSIPGHRQERGVSPWTLSPPWLTAWPSTADIAVEHVLAAG